MATSGSTNYNRTAQQLIKSSLRLLGVIRSSEEPSPSEMQDSLEALEMMIKTLQASGSHLWTNSEATLFLTPATASYPLTGSRAVSTFVETTSSADAAISAVTIDVNTIEGISSGDVIGIVTSSTAVHWSTVDGAPAGSTVTFADSLPAAATSGAVIYVYTASTDLIDRPLRIESIRRRGIGGIDIPLGEMSREDYYDLPNKSSSSTPVQYYYNPGRDTGTLLIWPTPLGVTETLKLTYVRPIEDFDSTSNNADLPQEWLEPLKYQLALRLAPEFGVIPSQLITSMATGLMQNAMSWDIDPTSVYFQPAFSQ